MIKYFLLVLALATVRGSHETYKCLPRDWFYGQSADMAITIQTVSVGVNSPYNIYLGGTTDNPAAVNGDSLLSGWGDRACILEKIRVSGTNRKIVGVQALVESQTIDGQIVVVPEMEEGAAAGLYVIITSWWTDGGFSNCGSPLDSFVYTGTNACGVLNNQVIFQSVSDDVYYHFAVLPCSGDEMILLGGQFSNAAATFLNQKDYVWHHPGTGRKLMQNFGVGLFAGYMGTQTISAVYSTVLTVFQDDAKYDHCRLAYSNTIGGIDWEPRFYYGISSVGSIFEGKFGIFMDQATPGPNILLVGYFITDTIAHNSATDNPANYLCGNKDINFFGVKKFTVSDGSRTLVLKSMTLTEFNTSPTFLTYDSTNLVHLLVRFSLSNWSVGVNKVIEMNPHGGSNFVLTTLGEFFNKNQEIFYWGAVSDFNYIAKAWPDPGTCIEVTETTETYTVSALSSVNRADLTADVTFPLLTVSPNEAALTNLNSETALNLWSDRWKNPCGVCPTIVMDTVTYPIETTNVKENPTGVKTLPTECTDVNSSQITYHLVSCPITGLATNDKVIYNRQKSDMDKGFEVQTSNAAYAGDWTCTYQAGISGMAVCGTSTFTLSLTVDGCTPSSISSGNTVNGAGDYFTYFVGDSATVFTTELGTNSNGDCDFSMALVQDTQYSTTGTHDTSVFTLNDVVTTDTAGLFSIVTPPSVEIQTDDLAKIGFYDLTLAVLSHKDLVDTSFADQDFRVLIYTADGCTGDLQRPGDGAIADQTLDVFDTIQLDLAGFSNGDCDFILKITDENGVSYTGGGLMGLTTQVNTKTAGSFNTYPLITNGKLNITPTLNSQVGTHTLRISIFSNRFSNDKEYVNDTTYTMTVTINQCILAMDNIPVLNPSVFYFTLGVSSAIPVALAEWTTQLVPTIKCGGFIYVAKMLDGKDLDATVLSWQDKRSTLEGSLTTFYSSAKSITKTQYDVRVTATAVVDSSITSYIDFSFILIDPCIDVVVSYPGSTTEYLYTAGEGKVSWVWDKFVQTGPSICADFAYTITSQVTFGTVDSTWFTTSTSKRQVTFTAPDTALEAVITFTIKGTVHGNETYPSLEVTYTITIQLGEVIAEPFIEPVVANVTETEKKQEVAVEVPVFDWKPPKFVKKEGVVQEPPIPWISLISKTGDCIINFTKPMMIPPRWTNLTKELEAGVYNESIHLFLKLRVISDVDFDPDQHAFDIVKFNLTKFTPQGLVLKITFSHPELITSDRLQPDMLYVEFNDTTEFFDAIDYLSVVNDTEIWHEMPPQLSESKAVALAALDKAAASSGTVVGAVNVVLSLLLSFALKFVWNMVNLLQFLVFIPQWQLAVSENALSFVKFLKSVALMEFIPYKGFTDAVSKAFNTDDEEFDTTEQDLAAISTANATEGSNSTGNDTSGVRRRRLQLEASNGTNSTNETTSTEVKRASENSKKLGSSNIVENMGIMLLFGAIIFVLILIVFLFRLVANMNYRIYRIYQQLQRKVFYNLFLRYALQACLKTQMGIGAAILFADWSTKKGTIMGYAAIALEVLILLIPFLFYYILKKNRDKLALPSMRAKIGTIYMGVNLTSFWSLMYSFIFLWRRNVFIGITYLLFDYPGLQVHLFLYSNVFYMIYINLAMPHSEVFSLVTEIVNEVMFQFICYHFVLFTNIVFDPFIREQIGWSLVSFIVTMFAFNMGVIVYVTCKGLSRKFYLKKLKKIHLKAMNERAEQKKGFVIPENAGSRSKRGPYDDWAEPQKLPNPFSHHPYGNPPPSSRLSLPPQSQKLASASSSQLIEASFQSSVSPITSHSKGRSQSPQRKPLPAQQSYLPPIAVPQLAGIDGSDEYGHMFRKPTYAKQHLVEESNKMPRSVKSSSSEEFELPTSKATKKIPKPLSVASKNYLHPPNKPVKQWKQKEQPSVSGVSTNAGFNQELDFFSHANVSGMLARRRMLELEDGKDLNLVNRHKMSWLDKQAELEISSNSSGGYADIMKQTNVAVKQKDKKKSVKKKLKKETDPVSKSPEKKAKKESKSAGKKKSGAKKS